MLFHKVAPYISFEKKYLYLSIAHGQPREPALCQLYRHTFLPYMKTRCVLRARECHFPGALVSGNSVVTSNSRTAGQVSKFSALPFPYRLSPLSRLPSPFPFLSPPSHPCLPLHPLSIPNPFFPLPYAPPLITAGALRSAIAPPAGPGGPRSPIAFSSNPQPAANLQIYSFTHLHAHKTPVQTETVL